MCAFSDILQSSKLPEMQGYIIKPVKIRGTMLRLVGVLPVVFVALLIFATLCALLASKTLSKPAQISHELSWALEEGVTVSSPQIDDV